MMNNPRYSWNGVILVLITAVFISFIIFGRQNNLQAETASPAPFVLNYQGALLDPASGDPKPDGVYEMSFRIYDVASGGVPLWQETKDIHVADGVFSTALGDVTPLDPELFNGQALWLGIKVGSDVEATPRQLVTFVGYAFFARNSDTVDGRDAASFANTDHDHGGGDITSGTVNQSFIDGAIARDGEVTTAVANHTANASAHHTRYSDAEAWNAVLARDGSGSGLNADYLDGYSYSSFAFASHTHDTRYYTESESNTNFVNATGDTMSGVLTVPRVAYTSPRTHYYSVGGEAFQPGSDVSYSNTYGCGGAYASTGNLVAPLNLPDGAFITSFRVYFNDTSTNDIGVHLYRQYLSSCGYYVMASVDSSGTSGYYNLVDSSVSAATIDNANFSYSVIAAGDWDGSLIRVKAVIISYTLSEAP